MVQKLDEPVRQPFDCGQEAQNQSLYDPAWRDQQSWLSTTYLYRIQGILAAYASVCASSLTLGTREKPSSVRYRSTGALKILQLGVDRRFQGYALGSEVLADIIALARIVSERAACRYVSLDARPDLVRWYQVRGFAINKSMQRDRIESAQGRRSLDELPVSMRFDLLDPSWA